MTTCGRPRRNSRSVLPPGRLSSSIGAGKEFHVAREARLVQFFDYQREAQETMFRTEGHREGVRSFVERRDAKFTGR